MAGGLAAATVAGVTGCLCIYAVMQLSGASPGMREPRMIVLALARALTVTR